MPKLTASGKSSQAWKALERQIAAKLREVGFTAERSSLDGGLYESSFDVTVAELPFLKNDGKYKVNGFTNDALLEVTEQKYCKNPEDEAIVYTKKRGQVGFNVTLRGDFWVKVLAGAFLGGRSAKGVWACNNCGSAYTLEERAIGNLTRFTCPDCGLVIYSEGKP